MTNVLNKAMKKNKFHMHTSILQGSPNLPFFISSIIIYFCNHHGTIYFLVSTEEIIQTFFQVNKKICQSDPKAPRISRKTLPEFSEFSVSSKQQKQTNKKNQNINIRTAYVKKKYICIYLSSADGDILLVSDEST